MSTRNLMLTAIIGLLLSIVLIAPAAATRHYYVDANNGNDAGGDGSEGNPWKTITKALSEVSGSASDTAVIHVRAGNYSPHMGPGGHEEFPLNMKSYVSIEGTGHADVTIDADNGNPAIECRDVTHVTISGVTIQNGHAQGGGYPGGGIWIEGSSYITVQSCHIRNNEGYWGGGIHVPSNALSILIDDCDIYDNVSTQGTGAGVRCGEGTTVSNCRIYRNDASTGEGAHGGGVLCGAGTVEYCDIYDNQAQDGAGIYCSNNGRIENCEFWGNVATRYGGGICCELYYRPRISNCTFNSPVHDSPNRAESGAGLAVVYESRPEITDCTFYKNEASGNGGAIYCHSDANLRMRQGQMTENKAANGGAISCSSSSPSFDSVIISGNKATTGHGGAAYIVSQSNPSFVNCTISSNESQTGNGGGLYIGGGSTPRFTTMTTISGNRALSGDGGGVYSTGASSPVFESIWITSNQAQNGAGASLVGSAGDFVQSKLMGNTASQSGGGVYASGGSTPEFDGNVISGNSAEAGDGGGICSVQSSLTLTGNIISSNQATGYGGGLCVSDNSTLTLDGFDRISKNTAANGGGGIYYDDSSGGTAFNTVVDENEVTGSPDMGGGVLCDTSATPELLCCTIYGNLSSGVVATGGATPTLTNCILWANTIDVDGIDCSQISHCDIEDGSCSGQSGNFSADPLFVLFYEGEAEEEQTFYLSQRAAGQAEDSPCVDSGDDQASSYGLDLYTTASDGRRDKDEVDLGAHYADRYRGKLYYVDAEEGDDTNDGSQGSPWRTITHALSQVDGESLKPKTIIVESGTYSGSMHPTQHESFPLEMKEFVALEAATTDSDAKTIDAEGNHRVININVDHVAIYGLTIQNGNANHETNTEGGGIRLDNAGRGTILINNVIKDSTATKGGGIYCVSSNPWVEHGSICGNTAHTGAGIAIETNSNPELRDLEIYDNTGSAEGGGIYVGETCSAHIVDCDIFSQNSGPTYGGGIYVANGCTLTISGGSVRNNLASVAGGGIYLGDNCSPTLSDCSVTENISSGPGGGIYMGSSCTPIIQDCYMASNTASAEGGALRMGDGCTLDIADCTITLNESADRGGAVYMGAGCGATITECSLDDNDASSEGGGLYLGNGCTATISGGTVSSNDASLSGGGLFVGQSCSLTISDCSISSNTSGASGGGLACSSSSEPSLTNCELTGNSAVDGGGIFLTDVPSADITDCRINENSADQDGGGLACTDGSAPTFLSAEVNNNTAGRYGGGVFCTSSSPRFERRVLVCNNTAGNAGGGVYCASSSSPYILNALIVRNEVTGDEGLGCGIYCDGASAPAIVNCTIANNGGSGVFATGGSLPTLTNCILWENGDDIDGVGCGLISHCDIEDGDCEGQDGNICQDPEFVPIYAFPYYLSHTGAQSSQSPCVDAGLGQSSDYGLDDDTTCTDGRPDEGVVDMGYHYEEGLDSYYVNADSGDDSNTGGYNDPWKTITHALGAVNGTADNPAFIQVASGLYDETNNGESFPLYPQQYTMLLGFDKEDTIIDGENSTYLIWCKSNLSISGFTITGGGAVVCHTVESLAITDCIFTGSHLLDMGLIDIREADGTTVVEDCVFTHNDLNERSFGCIHVQDGSATIRNCEVCGNYGGRYAGGIALDNASPNISGCTISRNQVRIAGGAVYALNRSSFTMSDCVLSDNELNSDSAKGGAIYLDDSDPEITNCRISGNRAVGGASARGGGIYMSSSDAIIEGCELSNNEAQAGGGGIYLSIYSNPTIQNCLITKNIAPEGGGLFYSWEYCDTELLNCTVEGNDTEGVRSAGSENLYLTNSIIWNNGDDVVNVDCSQISHCDIENDDEGCAGQNGNISADPLFVPLDENRNYTGYYLAQMDAQAADSPCLNAGDDQASAYGLDEYTTCTDGRYDQGVVDIGYHYSGAYEGEDDTYIQLASFEARVSGRNILIIWETGTEINNAGFDLYRFEAGDRTTLKKLNDRLIPAKGAPATGACYKFLDTNVRPGVRYDYWLVDIDTSGKLTLHGPASARVPKLRIIIPGPEWETPGPKRPERLGIFHIWRRAFGLCFSQQKY